MWNKKDGLKEVIEPEYVSKPGLGKLYRVEGHIQLSEQFFWQHIFLNIPLTSTIKFLFFLEVSSIEQFYK